MHHTLMARWILVFAVFLAASALANPPLPPVPTPQFRNYGLLEGLPGSHVQAVAQDSKGFIWIATTAGLVRFDGVDFTVPRLGGEAEHSLALGGAATMMIDHDDRVWIGGSGVGVGRYDPANGAFVQWREGLADDDVRAIAQTLDGSIWVGTAGGLDRILPNGAVEHQEVSPGGLHSSSIHALHATDDGFLWIGSTAGVDAIDPRGRLVQMRFADDSVPTVMHIDGRPGDLFFSTDKGLYRAGIDGRLRRDTRFPAALTFGSLADSHGNIWVATIDGLDMLDRHGRMNAIRGSWIASGGLPGRSVRSLMEDDEHGLWFGLLDAGLSYLGPGWEDFTRFTHVATESDSLPARAATAVAARHGASLWVGGYRGWIRAFDPATGKTSAGFDIGPSRIQSLHETSSGDLLIGTVDGLSIASHARVRPLARQTIRRPVVAMAFAPDDKVYVAAIGQGIFLVDPRTSSVTEIPFEAPCRGALDTRQMDVVDGELWQASVAGLSHRDLATGKMRPVEGVAPGRVNAFEPGDEGFWVVRPEVMEHYTWADGHATLDRSIGGADGFPAHDILNIRRDIAGRLWLYGQTGVWRFDPDPGIFRRFGLADGLANGEFTNAVTVQLADGTMYGTTLGGLVGFRPDRQRDHSHRPSIVVLGAGVMRNGVRQALSVTDEVLHIGWQDKELEIRARALSYVDPERNRLEIRLEYEGGSSRFFTGKDGTYRFDALSPGSYRLLITSAERDRFGAASVVPLRLQVDAPPWLRWWAWVTYAMLMGLVIGLVVHGTRRRVRQTMRLQLAEQERQLAEQANSAKTEFMATLGHEIRTPMTGVLGMAELMAQTRLDDTQRSYVEAVRRSGTTLLRLINDALDISRIESRQLILESEAVPIRLLADEVVALASGNACRKQLSLSVAVDVDVPEAVRGDPVRLRQILQNLVNNAVKFTERGGVSVHIAWENASLVLVVKDTGPGMSAELLSRLFSRFSQGGSPQRGEGSGLGLAICHELCVLMGGSITVDSEPGRGSTFVVRLPLDACVSDFAPLMMANPVPVREQRLLVVEDDPMVADVMLGLLRQRGYDVTVVGDGLCAMTELSRSRFDVLLLDLDLPLVDGFQVARMVRRLEHLATLPIVAVTARSEGDESAAIRDAGMDALVRKPMTGADLDAVLESVMH